MRAFERAGVTVLDHTDGVREIGGIRMAGFEDPLEGIDTSVPAGMDADALARTCLGLGDDALVYSHRLQQWMTRMPELEEETALARASAEEQRKTGMRQMADSFEQAVGGIVGMVSSSVTELQATAQTMTATATETASQSTTVAAAAEEAAVNVNTVAAAAEELGSSVQEIGRQVAEVMVRHRTRTRQAARAHALELLASTGLPEPDRMARSYPHQLSGGQRQRVVLAIAIANRPDLLICDEPTTALDVTVQARVLELIAEQSSAVQAALLFISHDLAVVASLCDRVLVMFDGRIVEQGTVAQVLDAPLHPYTAGLIGSVPSRTPRGQRLPGIPGLTPSVLNLPPGCAFRWRCARASARCEADPPEFAGDAGHVHRCFHPLVSVPA